MKVYILEAEFKSYYDATRDINSKELSTIILKIMIKHSSLRRGPQDSEKC